MGKQLNDIKDDHKSNGISESWDKHSRLRFCFFNWEDNPITKGIAISNINESIYPSIFCLYNLGLPGGSQLSQGKGGVYPRQVASLSHDTHSHIHTYSQFIFTSDPNPVETSASAEFL